MSKVKIHKPEDFEHMRAAGRLAASVLDYIAPFIKEGISTLELDKLCYEYIISKGAIPASLNYEGYPNSTCISLNYVVCHGIPGPERLRIGDILNIDVAVILKGWFGDTSRMFTVGNVSKSAEKLIKVTHEALMKAIALVRPGARLNDIGNCIEDFVNNHGFSVVRDYCGHGIGQTYHAEPQVLHYRNQENKLILKEGMFFTIEPMINAGVPDVFLLEDDWTVVTQDLSLSAQFEHSIGVTASGAEIFTL
ncbi:MAG: type I methionyl aminopeptidase [Holosporales bacterium]|jgi:methionyl aminopeptidase|nr:type I methionyl aminopeptidase [Holosporales bacterium]